MGANASKQAASNTGTMTITNADLDEKKAYLEQQKRATRVSLAGNGSAAVDIGQFKEWDKALEQVCCRRRSGR